MKGKTEMKKTSNPQVYKKVRKRVICNADGRCTICPYHGGENATRIKHRRKKQKKFKKR